MDSFFNLTLKELEVFTKETDTHSYRARQIYQWVYQHGVFDFHAMSNLSKPLRSALADQLSFALPEVREIVHSQDGSAKFALLLDNTISSKRS